MGQVRAGCGQGRKVVLGLGPGRLCDTQGGGYRGTVRFRARFNAPAGSEEEAAAQATLIEATLAVVALRGGLACRARHSSVSSGESAQRTAPICF